MKIKKPILVIATIFISGITLAQGIEFEQGNFTDALAKAKAENKMLFMDCYTVWCAPCKKLSKEIFPQKEVGDYFNKHFVSIKMDMEKGEGVELNKRYGVKVYPTLIFINSDGKLIHSIKGFMDGKVLISEAQKAVEQIN